MTRLKRDEADVGNQLEKAFSKRYFLPSEHFHWDSLVSIDLLASFEKGEHTNKEF